MKPTIPAFQTHTGHAPDCPGRCTFYSWEQGTRCVRYGPSIHAHRDHWKRLFDRLLNHPHSADINPRAVIIIERSCTRSQPYAADPLPRARQETS